MFALPLPVRSAWNACSCRWRKCVMTRFLSCFPCWQIRKHGRQAPHANTGARRFTRGWICLGNSAAPTTFGKRFKPFMRSKSPSRNDWRMTSSPVNSWRLCAKQSCWASFDTPSSGLAGLSARAGPQTRLFTHNLPPPLNISILNTLPFRGVVAFLPILIFYILPPPLKVFTFPANNEIRK